MTRESTMALTASSRSASSITIAGALPPNSRHTLVMFFAAVAMIFSPAETLPVILTIATFGLPASSCPTVSPRPSTRLNTPRGRPISSTILANAIALVGVNSLGLMTMVLPVKRAGAILRAMRKNGKFHGRMPVVTPSARLNKRIFSPGRSL